MRSRIVLSVLVLGGLAAMVFAQDPAPANGAPSPDAKAVAEALEGLKKAHKEKSDQDQVHFTKILADKWSAADEKQRKEALDLVEKNLKGKSQDVKDVTVESLAKMGGGEKEKDAEAATKILFDERQKKPTEENLTYFSNVVISMGKLHHQKGVQPLTKLLNYKDAEIIAAASTGLGHYKDSPLDLKKEIVEEILKVYTSAWNQAKANPRDTTVKLKLGKINVAMEGALKSLTGQTGVEGADKWWNWWTDTGKKAKTW